MLEVRFEVIFKPDTEDRGEALEEAREMMQMIRESSYASVRFGSEVRVIEWDDDQERD
jgi:hypothetical protein